MTKWNKTGFAKTGFLAIGAVLNYLNPIDFGVTSDGMLVAIVVGSILGWAIIGTFLVLLIVKVFQGKIEKPNWNTNPLFLSNPFVFLQFAAISFILIGFANVAGLLVDWSNLSLIGLQGISSGIGLLLAMRISKRILHRQILKD